MKYANIIVDISVEKLDKTFQYSIPENLQEEIQVGVQVDIPFGNRKLTGYVIELTEDAEFDPRRIRPIISVHEGSVAMESQLIALAGWMRKNYGSTMNQALKTVLPIRRQTKEVQKREIVLLIPKTEAQQKLALFEQKHYTAKARLLRELIQESVLDYSLVTGKLNISAAVIRGMAQQQILKVESSRQFRNPVSHLDQKGYHLTLNENQQRVVDTVCSDLDAGIHKTYLLRGVTGSGKTEVYMELIAHTVAQGRQAIVLIPEIALTYQTVMRFYNRFGDRVSIMNSKLSQGERFDQFERAKAGEIDIMIGPRSALFTPFEHLGLIVIDEEHETSYQSEMPPKYHAREVAVHRASMVGASVILGSATPSLESYYRAQKGRYTLFTLTKRAGGASLPKVWVTDLREELERKNRSIFGGKLMELMQDRLAKKEQIILFLNRRGYAGSVSCRKCGEVIKCPHCSVSMTAHMHYGRLEHLVCHYCGYQATMPALCPKCRSRYIGTFGIGTQKVEQLVREHFPQARVLRMDADTTTGKEGHEKILRDFAAGSADILIGTQMIVKGHDFPNVTLVGILAADLSLNVGDFRAAERTYQLLAQAAGRAGRGEKPGDVVLQTYQPEHYSIVSAAKQDYLGFYEQELIQRQILHYPPVSNILGVLVLSEQRGHAQELADRLAEQMRRYEQVVILGPAPASLSKAKDVYRYVIYAKCADYRILRQIKNGLEQYMKAQETYRDCRLQFDFNL